MSISKAKGFSTLTLRKQKHRSVRSICLLDEDNSIYSTLSKKPADLNTTDIDLSAIRIFLGDGSHRTVACTASTTCGEMLDTVLTKLGLLQDREEYGLKIKYKFAEPRIAEDSDKVSELNKLSIMDSVDRIYLCKKTDAVDVPVFRKKRLASFDGLSEDVYQNSAIIMSHKYAMETENDDMKPVLVNDRIANGFAKAWDRGSQLHECGSPGDQKPMMGVLTLSINDEDSPKRQSYSTYTLERKTKIKRSTPVSPSSDQRYRRSKSHEMEGRGHRKSPLNLSHERHPSPHYLMPTSPDTEGAMRIYSNSSPTSPIGSANKGNLTLGKKKGIGNLFKLNSKSRSLECLISSVGDNQETDIQRANSTLALEDSGFRSSSQCSLGPPLPSCPITLPSRVYHRKKSISLNDIPTASTFSLGVKSSVGASLSYPSLAKHHIKAKRSESTNNISSSNVNAASLKSCQSMEMLTGEDFEAIQTRSMTIGTFSPTNSDVPPVPKRSSSILENCSVSDDYLIKQGKRLSQILSLAPDKKQQKSTIKKFINKVGTLWKRKELSSPPAVPRRPLGTPTRLSPISIYPEGHWAVRKQPGNNDHDSDEDEDVYVTPNHHPQQPSRSPLLSPSDREQNDEEYDVAVPAPIPQRKPEYLQIISPTQSQSPQVVLPMYENKHLDETKEHMYQTPPSHHLTTSPTKHDYENKHITSGPNDQITFNGSPLHDYNTPNSMTSSSSSCQLPQQTNVYENNEIHNSVNAGIAIGGGDLHIYHVPKQAIQVPPPPPPPKLPPKPSNSTQLDNIPPPLPPKPVSEHPDKESKFPLQASHSSTTLQSSSEKQESATPTSQISVGLLDDEYSKLCYITDKKSGTPNSPTTQTSVGAMVEEYSKLCHSTDRKKSADNTKPSPAQITDDAQDTRSRSKTEPRVHTYPAMKEQRKLETLSDIYYEDITDWIPKQENAETEEHYSKLNWGTGTAAAKPWKSVTDLIKHITTKPLPAEPEPLHNTNSEPDLRCSQIYETIPGDIPPGDEEYVCMKSGVTTMNTSNELQPSVQLLSVKKPSVRRSHSSVGEKAAMFSSMGTQITKALQKRPKKLPILPPPVAKKNIRSCSPSIKPPPPPTLPKPVAQSSLDCSPNSSIPVSPPPPPIVKIKVLSSSSSSNTHLQPPPAPPLPKPFIQSPSSPASPPPPPPIATIPRIRSDTLNRTEAVPPPPPPPPPLLLTPKQHGVSPPHPLTPQKSGAKTPPPPPVAPMIDANVLKSAKLKKTQPQTSRVKPKGAPATASSSSELFSAELFAKIKSISKRLDNENSESNIYGNMA